MGLPNATSIIKTLPSGIRAIVSRGSTVATYAARTAINEAPQSTSGGLSRFSRANVWTLIADFAPVITTGDYILVDSIPGIVENAMTSCGNLVSKAQVILFPSTLTVSVKINGKVGIGLSGSDIIDTAFNVVEKGQTTGVVIVTGHDFDAPTGGATIIVSGKSVMVSKVDRIAFGIHEISYIVSNPVT